MTLTGEIIEAHHVEEGVEYAPTPIKALNMLKKNYKEDTLRDIAGTLAAAGPSKLKLQMD